MSIREWFRRGLGEFQERLKRTFHYDQKVKEKVQKLFFLAGAGFEPGSTKVSTEGALAH